MSKGTSFHELTPLRDSEAALSAFYQQHKFTGKKLTKDFINLSELEIICPIM